MASNVPSPDDPKFTCRCGRWNNKIHCPGCGYYTVSGLARKREIVDNPNGGDPLILNCFRCRRCLLVFNDMDWRIGCEAPNLQTETMRHRRQKDLATVKVKTGMDDVRQTALARGASLDEARSCSMYYFALRTFGEAKLQPEHKVLLQRYGFLDLVSEAEGDN